ncbi:class I adenylate cyclase [Shewanella sp. NIFS-20-20]|nr:class I adenylate cyclase [Shewanella sp. NIFS-20-20]
MDLKHKIQLSGRLNRVRLARAKALMTPLQRQLLHLIPWLFHYHHPQLPGFNGSLTPHGVEAYQGGEIEDSFAKLLDLSMASFESKTLPAIAGIYAMGSTATFGQNNQSDLDIWLVIDQEFTDTQTQSLMAKAHTICQWYEGFQLDVNCYIVHANQFILKGRGQRQLLAKEHSGNVQHWLLLEEFYRNHIHLAGRPVAWWPQARHDPSVLYLGDVYQLPASEYFGASLWQLYKGLVKPHKSLLKVMLLEAYASEFPHTSLISEQVWQGLLQGDFSSATDPYLLLYQCIETYLLKRQDLRRLEIVRRCFYLKCGVTLSNTSNGNDWRFHKMQTLVEAWGWDRDLIVLLDNCHQWDSVQLQWFNQQLNEVMLECYQVLLQFASRQQLNERLRFSELNMLSRKLSTYFTESKHQIVKLNMLWSQSIWEPRLTIVGDPGKYQLWRGEGDDAQVVFRADTKTALISWACLNGVADQRTQWVRQAHRSDPSVLIDYASICRTLVQTIDTGPRRISGRDLSKPWYFRQLIFILNMEDDPTARWQGQEMMVDYTQSNVFSLGRVKQNMLASVDVFSVNSWGECHCVRYSGNSAILEALHKVSHGLRRSPERVNLAVLCHSQRLKNQLSLAVNCLLQQTARLSHHQQSTYLVQSLHLGECHYRMVFGSDGMHYHLASDAESSQDYLKPQLQEIPRPDLGEQPLSGLPIAAREIASFGVVQYFLRDSRQGIDVFILNDQNELSHYVETRLNMVTLVRHISAKSIFDDQAMAELGFNMPQFYTLVQGAEELEVMPFGFSNDELNGEF